MKLLILILSFSRKNLKAELSPFIVFVKQLVIATLAISRIFLNLRMCTHIFYKDCIKDTILYHNNFFLKL